MEREIIFTGESNPSTLYMAFKQKISYIFSSPKTELNVCRSLRTGLRTHFIDADMTFALDSFQLILCICYLLREVLKIFI